MLSGVSADNGSDPLVQTAREIQRVEGILGSLRSERDAEIQRRARSDGTSERELSRLANVSPSYAHRAVVHGRLARRVRA